MCAGQLLAPFLKYSSTPFSQRAQLSVVSHGALVASFLRHPSKGSRIRRYRVHHFVCVCDGGIHDVHVADLQRAGQLLAVSCLHVACVYAVVLW